MEQFNFWNEIPRPIIGLSPMDGVTDATFRQIVARHGKPSLILTEFTSVDGICHGARSELSGLIFNEIERPIAAQIYGANPEAFFHVAQLVCELGFDGLDINMGCPAKAVASRGCGASLIQTPNLAKEIIRATRRGIDQWVDGAPLSILKLHPPIADWLAASKSSRPQSERRPIPVSVKTRLGVGQIVIKEWVQTLLEESPAAISIHGRTLAQRYTGSANWEAIADAVNVARGSKTLILGNGDIMSLTEARQRIAESGVDGVLIGQAALGNPWIFRDDHEPPSARHRLDVAIEHATLFEEIRGVSMFAGVRKHLGWYCKGFRGASELRAKLVLVKNAKEAEALMT